MTLYIFRETRRNLPKSLQKVRTNLPRRRRVGTSLGSKTSHNTHSCDYTSLGSKRSQKHVLLGRVDAPYDCVVFVAVHGATTTYHSLHAYGKKKRGRLRHMLRYSNKWHRKNASARQQQPSLAAEAAGNSVSSSGRRCCKPYNSQYCADRLKQSKRVLTGKKTPVRFTPIKR